MNMSLGPNTEPVIPDDCFMIWLQNFIKRTEVTQKFEKDKGSITLQLQEFSPQNITVKTLDGCIVVEGKREKQKNADNYTSMRFVKTYPLPEGCRPESVVSRLSSDGVLTITMPTKPASPLATLTPFYEDSNVISKL